MLFGINVTQTYVYYIHSKKCVSLPNYNNNSSISFLVCLFQRSIVDQNIGGLITFEPVFCQESEPAFGQQVVIIFVADFVQPMFLSIYLYRTLIVHFGMRCSLISLLLNIWILFQHQQGTKLHYPQRLIVCNSLPHLTPEVIQL